MEIQVLLFAGLFLVPFIGSDSSGVSGTVHSFDNIAGRLLRVNAGTFAQGSPTSEACRLSNETQFTHTLIHDLAVMETEVTQKMWNDLRAVQPSLPANPSSFKTSSSLPVESVTWYEAVLFANLLSDQNGLERVYYANAQYSLPIDASDYTTATVYQKREARGYRLPTEGEWEYFARAGTPGPFSVSEPNYNSGTCETCTAGTLPQLEQVAWYCANAGSVTHPVGQKAANPWGLKDVHGNVREWVWDWYEAAYPGDSQTDYPGPSSGSRRVIREGSWFSPSGARGVRSAARNAYSPDRRLDGSGFRLLRSLH